MVCPKKMSNNNCEFSDPEKKFCFDLKKLGVKTPPVKVSLTFRLINTIKSKVSMVLVDLL